MKSLIIYYSKFGNTERIAWAISQGLTERGEARVVALGDLRAEEIAAANLLVVGTPTQMRGMPMALRRFLRRSPRESWFGFPVAVFDTRLRGDRKKTGSAAIALGHRLQRIGALLVSQPESFFVTGMKGPLEEGELSRARLWGRQLHLSDRVAVDGE